MKTTDKKDVINLNLENVNKSIGNQKKDKPQSMQQKKGIKFTTKDRPTTIQGSAKKSFRGEYHTSDNAAKKIPKMGPNQQKARPMMQMISEAPMQQPRMRSHFLMMSSGSSTNPASEHISARNGQEMQPGNKHAHIHSGSALVGEEQGQEEIKKRLEKLKTKEEHDHKPKIIEQLNQFMGLRRQNVFVDQHELEERSGENSDSRSDVSVEIYKEILDSILSPTKMGPKECTKNMIEFQIFKGNTIITSRQQNMDNLMGVKPGQHVEITSAKDKDGSASTSSLETDSDLGLSSEEEGLGKKEDFQLFANQVNAANIYDDAQSAQTSGAAKSGELNARSAEKKPQMNTAQSQNTLKEPVKTENSEAYSGQDVRPVAPPAQKKQLLLKSRMRASQEQSPLAPIETVESAISIADEKNLIRPKQVSTIKASQQALLPHSGNEERTSAIITNQERPTTSGDNSLQGTRRNKVREVQTQHEPPLKGAIKVADSRTQSNVAGPVGLTGTTITMKNSQSKAGKTNKQNGPAATVGEEAPGYPPLSQRQRRIVRILSKPQAARYQMDIESLSEYFNEFDFLKKEKESAEEKQKKKMRTIIAKATDAADQGNRSLRKRQAIMMANEGDNALGSAPGGGAAMAKDKKSIEQMCGVMRHVSIPKYGIVFDYESAGDVFYMLLHGKVDCKVPFHKQIIHLSEAEYKMFIEEYKEDLQSIQDAKEINQMVKEKKSVEGLTQSKFQNPYDLSYEKLQERVNKCLEKEKYRLLRPLWDEQRKLQKKRHRSAASGEETEEEDNFQSRSQISLQTGIQELLDSARQSYTCSVPSKKEGAGKSQGADNTSSLKTINAMFRGKALSHKEQHVLNESHDLGCLQEAAALVLQSHNPRKQPRRYYSISILKHVFTYNEFGSFGELALITNKRRAAKLEVTADSDAHFAVLSKKDYRQTQYKVQTQILQSKIAFLRQFDFLKAMSDSNMSGLSYSMEEYVCSRGQALYHEGLDPCDYLYFVKSGEFLTVKKVPVERKTSLDMHNILDEDVFEDVQKKGSQMSGKKNNIAKVVSMKKVRQRQNMLRFNNQNMGDMFEYVKICIHQKYDMFGYQELDLLSNDSGVRQYTVICAKAGSTVVAIKKDHLAQHMRRNTTLIDQQIVKWKMIFNSRIMNWQRMKESLADKRELIQETFESLTYQEQARQQEQEKEREEEIVRIRNQHKNKTNWESQPPAKEALTEDVDAPAPVTIQEPKSTAQRFGRDSQQSVLDNRFNDFRKSLISSVSPQHYGQMKQFQAKLEEKVETYQVHSHSRLEKPEDFDFKRVLPESARLYSSMLHSNKIQTRINMKQQLFNYYSNTAKSRHASLQALKKQKELRSSIGSALGMPQSQVSDAYQLRDMSRLAEPTQQTQFPRILEANRTATNPSSFRYGQAGANLQRDRNAQSQLGPLVLGGAYNTLNAGEERSDVSGDVRFKNSILTSQLQQDNHYGGVAQMNASVPTNLRTNPTEDFNMAHQKMKTAQSQQVLQKPEEFADWNKESLIVQNQCSKFFMKKQPTHGSRQQLKSDGTTQESAAHQMGLGGSKTQLLGDPSGQPTRQSLHSILNDNLTDKSIRIEDAKPDRSREKIYKDIQQTVQQSINPSKQYDADKDLEDITDFKNQNQPSIFEVLQDWNLKPRDSQSEKRSGSPPMAAKFMKKNLNLLQNPLLNKALKRSVFTSLDAQSHAVGVENVDKETNPKRKLLIYSKKNRVSYQDYQSMHPNNRTLQQNKTEIEFSINDSQAISYQRTKKMLVTDSLATSQPYGDQDPSKKSKKQTQTMTFHGRLNTSQHEQEQSKLRKSSEPKIIMRQLLFDKESVNPKNIENQDALRQSLVTNLIGEPEVIGGQDKAKAAQDSSQSKLSAFKLKKQAKSRKAFGPGSNVSHISKPSREPSRAALQVESMNKESSLGRSDQNVSINTELMKNDRNASNTKQPVNKDLRRSKNTDKKSDKQSVPSPSKNAAKVVPGASRQNSTVSITQTAHGKKTSSFGDGQRDQIGSIDISDLDLLPEYRINSRKRSPAEIARVKAYHRDNHHNFKFVVDVQHASTVMQESKEEGLASKSSNRTQRRKPRQ